MKVIIRQEFKTGVEIRHVELEMSPGDTCTITHKLVSGGKLTVFLDNDRPAKPDGAPE